MILPPLQFSFTLIDVLIFFCIETSLILILLPKRRIQDIWTSILLINLVKIGSLSLLQPLLPPFYYANYQILEFYFLILLGIGFIVSLLILEKDLELTRQDLLFPLFITNFFSASVWKVINSGIINYPFFTVLNTEANTNFDGILTEWSFLQNFLLIIGIITIFYFKKSRRIQKIPTN